MRVLGFGALGFGLYGLRFGFEGACSVGACGDLSRLAR